MIRRFNRRCSLGPGAIVAVVLLGAGCSQSGGLSEPPPEIAERHAMNIFSINAYYDEMIHSAVVREHTLYPHHFANHRDQLNELGERDLAILADRFRHVEEGTINVRRGEEDARLYEARLRHVNEQLQQFGIPADRIELVDGFPGGDGVGGERAVLILMSDRARTLGGDGFSTDTGPTEIR